VLATEADEPVLLGAAMLGGVAGGLFGDVATAMGRMSRVSRTYAPAGDAVAGIHDGRYRSFERLQEAARAIRASGRDARDAR